MLIEKAARAQGMITMEQDGRRACLMAVSDGCKRLIPAAKHELLIKIAATISPHSSQFLLFARNYLFFASRKVIKQTLIKVLQGQTTIEEVWRVTKD